MHTLLKGKTFFEIGKLKGINIATRTFAKHHSSQLASKTMKLLLAFALALASQGAHGYDIDAVAAVSTDGMALDGCDVVGTCGLPVAAQFHQASSSSNTGSSKCGASRFDLLCFELVNEVIVGVSLTYQCS